MPGYLVHIVSASEDLRSSKLGFKGLIAPDLWKKHTPTYDEYLQFFYECFDAPSYEQVKLLCSDTHGGTHFGKKSSITNCADFAFIATLFATKQLDSENPFFKGYIHHLRVDKNFYADSSICDRISFNNDFVENRELARETLHNDWDKTNNSISQWYPEVRVMISALPRKAQDIIQFVDGIPQYISLDKMHIFIENMHQFKSIEELLNG